MRLRWLILAVSCASSGCDSQGVSPSSGIPSTASESPEATEHWRCPASTFDALDALKGRPDSEWNTAREHVDLVFCQLAVDALCTSTPQATPCKQRSPVGAYGGYYLARHMMPLVVTLRAELTASIRHRSNPVYLQERLLSMGRILDLLEPGLGGCSATGLRTWCTVQGQNRSIAPSHRYAIAHLASEILRLLSQCQELMADCPLGSDVQHQQRTAIWYDLLVWDHALLEATPIRNSFTSHLTFLRRFDHKFEKLRSDVAAGHPDRAQFFFHAEGKALALAANLLAVDKILNNTFDPRLSPLTDDQRTHLLNFINLGVTTLSERLSSTQVFDFDGEPRTGAVFDEFAWDLHPYRRFSAATERRRPFDARLDTDSGELRLRFNGPEKAIAQGSGLDSGHYRRLAWLYYTLEQTGKIVGEEWVDEETLQQLANQFAYAVYLHPCRNGHCMPVRSATTPRFANYASGINGWYRLNVETPCEPGVPPSGFSTQMLLSENLWWGRFNTDVVQIWHELTKALNDPEREAPSVGDVAPCGPSTGEPMWHKSYYDVASSDVLSDRYYTAAFSAMQRWAAFSLGQER